MKRREKREEKKEIKRSSTPVNPSFLFKPHRLSRILSSRSLGKHNKSSVSKNLALKRTQTRSLDKFNTHRTKSSFSSLPLSRQTIKSPQLKPPFPKTQHQTPNQTSNPTPPFKTPPKNLPENIPENIPKLHSSKTSKIKNQYDRRQKSKDKTRRR